jgi:hypothetical protein
MVGTARMQRTYIKKYLDCYDTPIILVFICCNILGRFRSYCCNLPCTSRYNEYKYPRNLL